MGIYKLGLDRQKNERTIVNIFLSVNSFNKYLLKLLTDKKIFTI